MGFKMALFGCCVALRRRQRAAGGWWGLRNSSAANCPPAATRPAGPAVIVEEARQVLVEFASITSPFFPVNSVSPLQKRFLYNNPLISQRMEL